MDQATGYSVFAQNGFAGSRHGITQLVTAPATWCMTGPRMRCAAPGAVRASAEIHEHHADGCTGGGHGAARQIPNIVVAGKTGTTQSYRDAWFVGFTGNYTRPCGWATMISPRPRT